MSLWSVAAREENANATLRQIPFRRQVDVEIHYKGYELGKTRLDFLVEEAVVVEIKAVEQLASIHTAQVISYLSITGHPLGLLINFNVEVLKHGISRIVLTK